MVFYLDSGYFPVILSGGRNFVVIFIYFSFFLVYFCYFSFKNKIMGKMSPDYSFEHKHEFGCIWAVGSMTKTGNPRPKRGSKRSIKGF